MQLICSVHSTSSVSLQWCEQAAWHSHIPECQSSDVILPVLRGLASSQVTAQTKHSQSALTAHMHKKGFQTGVNLKTSKLLDFSLSLFFNYTLKWFLLPVRLWRDAVVRDWPASVSSGLWEIRCSLGERSFQSRAACWSICWLRPVQDHSGAADKLFQYVRADFL